MNIKLRNRLRSISNRNQSLQDILNSCNKGDQVVSVSPVSNGVHNTKLVLKLKTGEKRVHFYNRVDLKDALPSGLLLPIENISKTLNILNVEQQGDFEREDLIFNEFDIEAHPDSLGYIGRVATFPWTIKYRVISTGEIVRINTGSIVSAHTIDPQIFNELGEIISDPSALNDRDDLVISRDAKMVESLTLHPAGWKNLTNLSSDAEEVKDEAFVSKKNLINVHIGPDTRKWGNGVTAACSSIENFIIEEGIERFGASVLTGCKVEELILPRSLNHISDNAFVGCNLLKKLIIGISTVTSKSFGGSLRNLKHLEFTEGVENIYDPWAEAAENCEILLLPQGLINLGTVEDGYIFGDFEKIKKLVIPGTVKFIGRSCFQGLNSLEELTIEEGVGYISSYAFQNYGVYEGNHPLKVFNLLGGETFASSSFQNWNLAKRDLDIVIPKTTKLIEKSAFVNHEYTAGLSFHSECEAVVEQDAFLNWFNATRLTIGDKVKSVASSFTNWYLCQELYIGRSLKTLGIDDLDGWGVKSEFQNFGNNLEVPIPLVVIPDNIETIYGVLNGGSKVSSIVVSNGLKTSGVIGGSHTSNYFYRSQTPPIRLTDRIDVIPGTHYYVPTLGGWSNLPEVAEENSQVTLKLYTPPEDAYSPHL